MVVDGLIAVVVTGRFLQYDFSIFECESNKREDCILTIFDLIKDDFDNISPNYENLRNGRCGISMIISGAYLMIIGLNILVPDISN